jgi:hypothetical protein
MFASKGNGGPLIRRNQYGVLTVEKNVRKAPPDLLDSR